MLRVTLPFFVFTLMMKSLMAGTTTIELQNGVNSYSGCVDSYMEANITEAKGVEETIISGYG